MREDGLVFVIKHGATILTNGWELERVSHIKNLALLFEGKLLKVIQQLIGQHGCLIANDEQPLIVVILSGGLFDEVTVTVHGVQELMYGHGSLISLAAQYFSCLIGGRDKYHAVLIFLGNTGNLTCQRSFACTGITHKRPCQYVTFDELCFNIR